MSGEMDGGKGHYGGQEEDRMGRPKKIGMKGFGIKSEGWREVAQKAGRRFRRVADGAGGFMLKWHDVERRQSDTARSQSRREPLTPMRARWGGAGGSGRSSCQDD